MTTREETITGWIARDEFANSRKDRGLRGTLCIYEKFPERDNTEALGGFWYTNGGLIELPRELFPELTWVDEPVYVKLTIEVLQ